MSLPGFPPDLASVFQEALVRLGDGNQPDDALKRLAERALQQAASFRLRAMKGAAGQKAAANERHRKYVEIARGLIAKRSRPYESYRQLAEDVAKNPAVFESIESIRRHLAKAGLLDK